MDRRECPVCGCRKSPRWRLCADCFDTYGQDQGEWPPWLVYLVADSKRWDYEFVRDSSIEVYLDELNWDGSFDGERGDDMPYAPYADGELNRQYRLANDIPD